MDNIKKIICDDREFNKTKKQKKFKEKIIKHFGEEKVEIKRLDVGDFIIILDDGTTFVIERKQDLDWISSCTSRRVQNQAIKMAERFNHKFIVIIGSYDSISKNRRYIKFSKKQWISNMVSLSIRYNTPVFMVETESDFLKLIDSISSMISRRNEPLIELNIVKKSNDVRVDMLSLIPKIGKKKAKLLINHFGSLRNIMDSKESDLTEVKGIGLGLAKEIKRWLK